MTSNSGNEQQKKQGTLAIVMVKVLFSMVYNQNLDVANFK